MLIDYKEEYQKKRVLITGGLGFIGSNLAISLVELGAEVQLVDAMIPEYGGNLFNIEAIRNKVSINFCNITDINAINYLVKDVDYIFHLAGQGSHSVSIVDPFLDIECNMMATLNVLEACKKNNRNAKIIFTGTRGQYKPKISLPAKEDSDMTPNTIYGVTNLAAEKLLLIYHNLFGLKSVMTRISNVYGPRAQMRNNKYGVPNWFLRLAIDDQEIPIYGSGKIKRDFLFVEDLIDALLMLPLKEECFGEVFNLGVPEPSNYLDYANLAIQHSNSGRIRMVPFPKESEDQEAGDYYPDISKAKQFLGWEPKVSLAEGIEKTIAYYKKYRTNYWNHQ
ncbi:NAD-dependent epimerase/dehydratase [Leptospira ryugenii]|uniref:NAD-dependent epimerase/dehydratase n=1 Tax=Leptospira ryugenii TaxID=1917863 RepID=A0A2P2DW18_9LEPT|nr:GDP-mannose 4,6-dehydratase [Leptospira ryugenii]GBF48831.1 NAD-dependent epimerase/dehydratase [Leptospira ryugenii]